MEDLVEVISPPVDRAESASSPGLSEELSERTPDNEDDLILGALDRLSKQRVTITSVDETLQRSCIPIDALAHLEEDDAVQVLVNRLFYNLLEEIGRSRGIPAF